MCPRNVYRGWGGIRRGKGHRGQGSPACRVLGLLLPAACQGGSQPHLPPQKGPLTSAAGRLCPTSPHLSAQSFALYTLSSLNHAPASPGLCPQMLSPASHPPHSHHSRATFTRHESHSLSCGLPESRRSAGGPASAVGPAATPLPWLASWWPPRWNGSPGPRLNCTAGSLGRRGPPRRHQSAAAEKGQPEAGGEGLRGKGSLRPGLRGAPPWARSARQRQPGRGGRAVGRPRPQPA